MQVGFERLMKGLFVSALVFAVGAVSTAANAAVNLGQNYRELGFKSQADMEKHFTVANIRVHEISQTEIQRKDNALERRGQLNWTRQMQELMGVPLSMRALEIPIGEIVAIGEKIWEIIQKGRPVVDVKTHRAAVLPAAQTDWREMESWKGPAMKAYRVTATNGFGSDVIGFTYRLAFHHSGSYNGHGSFLANATIVPEDIYVSWGFELNSFVEVGDAVNYGTKADPLPGLLMQVNWEMKSVMTHMAARESFVIKGDGTSLRMSEQH